MLTSFIGPSFEKSPVSCQPSSIEVQRLLSVPRADRGACPSFDIKTMTEPERDPKTDQILNHGNNLIRETVKVLQESEALCSKSRIPAQNQDKILTRMHSPSEMSLEAVQAVTLHHDPLPIDRYAALDDLFSYTASSSEGIPVLPGESDSVVYSYDHSQLPDRLRSLNLQLQPRRECLQASSSVIPPSSALSLLHELGTTRRSKDEPYIDVSYLEDPDIVQPSRGGYCELFPSRLHRMLETAAAEEEMAGILSFLPHGRAFRVHKIREFEEQILPNFFTCSKWGSFTRQLQLVSPSMLNDLRVARLPAYLLIHSLFFHSTASSEWPQGEIKEHVSRTSKRRNQFELEKAQPHHLVFFFRQTTTRCSCEEENVSPSSSNETQRRCPTRERNSRREIQTSMRCLLYQAKLKCYEYDELFRLLLDFEHSAYSSALGEQQTDGTKTAMVLEC